MRRLAPLILFLAGCFDPNLPRETYQDGKMARNFGAYQRGIVPAFLPDDARNITTANNEATKEVWVRCELPGDTLGSVTSAVPHVAMEAALARMQPPPEFLGQWYSKPPDAASSGFIYREGSREWHGVIEGRLCFVYCLPK